MLGDLIDRSSVGGATFELGSATYDMTRVLTGQLDAYLEPGPRLIDEVPGMRAEFERVGGGHVLNNSPYDLAAAALCAREGGAVVTDAAGRHARRPAAARRRRRVPDVRRLQREPGAARAPDRRDRPRHRAPPRPGTVGTVRWRRSRPDAEVNLSLLQTVSVGQKTLSDYTHIVGWPLIDEIRKLAEPLRGRRILHLSATAFGGGVSEILYTLVPLMRDVGLDAEWQVIYGREEFFNATKLMHNALQGNPQDLSEEEWEIWEQYNEMNARELTEGWDFCIVHDPQPAAMHSLVRGEGQLLGLALPHRPVGPQPEDDRAAAALPRELPGVAVPHEVLRAGGDGRAGAHRARRRSTRSRRRTWRCRPRTPPTCATRSASPSTAR